MCLLFCRLLGLRFAFLPLCSTARHPPCLFLLLLTLQLHKSLAVYYRYCSKILTVRPRSLFACIVASDVLPLNRLNVGSGHDSFTLMNKAA